MLMIDLDRIRAELNELEFKKGGREVFVGNLSEMFPQESEQAIAERVSVLEEDLRRHSLRASRRGKAEMPCLSTRNFARWLRTSPAWRKRFGGHPESRPWLWRWSCREWPDCGLTTDWTRGSLPR